MIEKAVATKIPLPTPTIAQTNNKNAKLSRIIVPMIPSRNIAMPMSNCILQLYLAIRNTYMVK